MMPNGAGDVLSTGLHKDKQALNTANPEVPPKTSGTAFSELFQPDSMMSSAFTAGLYPPWPNPLNPKPTFLRGHISPIKGIRRVLSTRKTLGYHK